MSFLNYKNGILHLEGVELTKLPTPTYLYSKTTIERQCKSLTGAFPSNTDFYYAVKANSNPEILRLISSLGFGVDVVSQGELDLAISVGISPKKIVFSGVGKTKRELERAIEVGIHSILIESTQELKLIGQLGKKTAVGIRINPDLKVETHPHIATGSHDNKFGVDEADLPEMLQLIAKNKLLLLTGLSCHLGSQLTSPSFFSEMAERMVGLAVRTKSQGFPISFVDLGGGLGIRYTDEKPIDVKDYARAITAPFKDTPFRIGLEPGRYIVGESGVLLTEVIRTKSTSKKHFVIVDAAMNDLIRPALYGAKHAVMSVKELRGETVAFDVVGPICESGDFLALDTQLPKDIKAGDRLAILTAGAYGYSMASNYNLRPRPAEVLVDGDQSKEIRKRQRLEEI